MRDEERLNPGHSKVRGVLRLVGPTVALAGLVLTAIGMISFFGAFGGGGFPRYFWCAFLGIPMLGVGLMICQFAYMGKIGRYVAGESAPVAKDTFNYMAEGTQEGVEQMAGAFGRGLAGGTGSAGESQEVSIRCHKCNVVNDADAKFCDGCGAPLVKSKACPRCEELNDPDARFCDGCGHRFVQ